MFEYGKLNSSRVFIIPERRCIDPDPVAVVLVIGSLGDDVTTY